MYRTIRGFLGLVALAALVACNSQAGGGDEGALPDSWSPIEVLYGDPGKAPDEGTSSDDVEDPGEPPVDAEDPGTPPADTQDPGHPVDPGADPITPVDNGSNDPGDVAPVDPGPPCDIVTSEFGYRDNCDGTVTDTKSLLVWEKSFQWAAGLDDAKRACVTSRTGGFSDWHLPTIDELRSLVVGCPATGTGGACVIHATSTCEDHESPVCFNSDCYGCAMNQGPVVNPAKPTQHCYMDATFDWYCNLFWSSTQVKAKGTGDKRSWYLTFYNAGIDVPPSMAQVQSNALRCVRNP